jgi:ketosteroid isomerase-like protein
VSAGLRARVLAANRAFYDAFEALDLGRMEACWEPSSRVACVHPGGPWLRGWEEVRESWETIFANTSYIEFQIAEPHVEVVDPLAWVTCVERIVTAVGAERAVSEIVATNVFVVDATGWHMILHHGSQVIRAAPRAWSG